MRTLETLLILINLFSIILHSKRRSKPAWLTITAVNMSVFMLHAVLEGFRYQMAFSYLFVSLLVIFTLIKTKHRFESRTPRALKGIAISLSLIFLLFASFLASALPVFTLPEPTGSYDVGIQYFHLEDEHRTDPFLDTSTQQRELMVKVYYPAMKDDSKPFSLYFHHSPELIRLFAKFYNMPGFIFDHLSLVKTHSREGVRLSDAQEYYPVILFSHGAGTSMEVHTSQSEDLASHGYIVVNIDHTYVSSATLFPDRIVSHHDATTTFDTPDPAEIITQIMVEDASFVMDTLAAMNDGQIQSMFTGRLDLDQVGVMGHSVGGAVAYNLAIQDSRVKAAINLDGRVYITPADDPKDMAPFLMLANDTFHVQLIQERKSFMKSFDEMPEEDQQIMLSIYGSADAYQEAYSRDVQNVIGLSKVLETSGNLFTIEGSDHMKFTDIGLFIGASQLREFIGIGGSTDPVRCLEITKALSVSFFDQHLKGTASDGFESLVQTYPELQNVDMK